MWCFLWTCCRVVCFCCSHISPADGAGVTLHFGSNLRIAKCAKARMLTITKNCIIILSINKRMPFVKRRRCCMFQFCLNSLFVDSRCTDPGVLFLQLSPSYSEGGALNIQRSADGKTNRNIPIGFSSNGKYWVVLSNFEELGSDTVRHLPSRSGLWTSCPLGLKTARTHWSVSLGVYGSLLLSVN